MKICVHCNQEFTPIRGAKGLYCSLDCMHKKTSVEYRPHWFECSKCLCKIGIGMGVQSRLLRANKGSLHRHWKKEGLKADVPECGDWRRYAEREKSKVCGWWGNSETAALWIGQHRARFPDWSSVWKKEKNKEASRSYSKLRYSAITPEEKTALFLKMREGKIQKHGIVQYRKMQKEKYAGWKASNPEKAKAHTRKAQAKMRKNPMYRIAINMRGRFKEIMDGVKTKPTQGRWELVGCSQSQLRRHLESQFKRGMTWENYGTNWHVDHILPCSSFDHRDPRQVSQCWHWTNLRPLDAKKNISKGATITEPQMSLLLCATH